MRQILLALGLLCVATVARAQVPAPPTPPPYATQQTVTCTSTSGALNFSFWPAPLAYVKLVPLDAGQTYIYVCTLGGTCSATTGVPLVAAQGFTFATGPTKPTCITDGTASVSVVGLE